MVHSSSSERVVIIGGGATSALIAVRLVERGFQVAILEKAQPGNEIDPFFTKAPSHPYTLKQTALTNKELGSITPPSSWLRL